MPNVTLIHAVPPDPPAKTNSMAPRARRFRLTSARAVRRELAGLYAELRNGQVTEDHARAAGFLLRSLLEALRIDEVEARISELEEEIR